MAAAQSMHVDLIIAYAIASLDIDDSYHGFSSYQKI